MLGILNHAMEEHRPNRDSATPNSLLRVIKLWYIMPGLLNSPDGRIKRRQRLSLLESGDMAPLLLWLMAYTRRGDSRQRDTAQEASMEAKVERVSLMCHPAGEVKVAARTLLADPRSAGNDETYGTLVIKFPAKDHTAVFPAAAATVLASATEVKDKNAPPWCLDD